jgi:hypothetical protein
MDVIWDLTTVTPGAIAASAIYVSPDLVCNPIPNTNPIQARFALTNDVALQRQGGTTKIDYEADFTIYLKFLVSGLADNKSAVKRIFRLWNSYFFPASSGPIRTGIVPTELVDDVFAALDNDLEGSESGSVTELDLPAQSTGGTPGPPPIQEDGSCSTHPSKAPRNLGVPQVRRTSARSQARRSAENSEASVDVELGKGSLRGRGRGKGRGKGKLKVT